MLALLCTAPTSSLSSPIEGTTTPARIPPPPPPPPPGAVSSSSAAATAGPSTNSFSLSSRKLSIRRPSIRKRIQSLSRVSSATLSNAAGSSLSFLRHASGSGSPPMSSSPASAPVSRGGTSTSGSSSAHIRGASTSSFASGKSTKSWKSNKTSGGSSGYGRLNVLHIGAPMSFKHQFHLGPNMTSDQAWDETRWRQIVEMRGNIEDNPPVIDVVPPTSSTTGEPPRASTSLDRNIPPSHTRSASQPALINPNLLTSTSPFASDSSSSSTPTSATDGSSNEPTEPTDKAKRQAKRASLVKRKPVPQLNPEDIEPLPNTPAPTQTTFVLMPDPAPSSGQAQVETAPTGRTSFEVSKEEAQKEALEKLVRSATVKERPTRRELNADGAATHAQMQVTFTDAPEHIFIRHPSPPPKPPPRRHTLAHMQARTLGRGMSDGPSLPSCPSITRPGEPQIQTQPQMPERKKGRARPVPIVAPSPTPSPGIMQDAGDVLGPAVPPGLSIPTKSVENKVGVEEKGNEVREEKKSEGISACAPAVDGSPRPSLSSLASTSESTETAGSASSCDLDLEPRTPTDERRVSAGSASSIKHRKGGNSPGQKNVRIVVPGHHLGLDLEEEQIDADLGVTGGNNDGEGGGEGERGEDVETPKVIRRASKRPNPPARRVETNEESVYVTADEAEDL